MFHPADGVAKKRKIVDFWTPWLRLGPVPNWRLPDEELLTAREIETGRAFDEDLVLSCLPYNRDKQLWSAVHDELLRKAGRIYPYRLRSVVQMSCS